MDIAIIIIQVLLGALGTFTLFFLKDLKEDVKALKVELKDDIKSLKVELKDDMKNLECTFKSDMKNIEANLKSDIKSVDIKLDSIRDRLSKVEGQEDFSRSAILELWKREKKGE